MHSSPCKTRMSSENVVYKNVIRQELIKYRCVESDIPNMSHLLSVSYGINEGREGGVAEEEWKVGYTRKRDVRWNADTGVHGNAGNHQVAREGYPRGIGNDTKSVH